MPQAGSKSVTLKELVVDNIEFLRIKMGKRSHPAVLETLVEEKMRRFR